MTLQWWRRHFTVVALGAARRRVAALRLGAEPPLRDARPHASAAGCRRRQETVMMRVPRGESRSRPVVTSRDPPIPPRALPPANDPVVAAGGTAPPDGAGLLLNERREDLAAAPASPRAPSAGDVRAQGGQGPPARDPRDDRGEEQHEVEGRAWEVDQGATLIEEVPQVGDPGVRHGIGRFVSMRFSRDQRPGWPRPGDPYKPDRGAGAVARSRGGARQSRDEAAAGGCSGPG